MAGEAKTENFMLGTATVMLGAQADLFDLTAEQHSIGLVKQVGITSEPTYTELTQGTKNTLVYSVMTQNTVRASMEVYEYTMQNLAYGMGLNGGSYTTKTTGSTVTTPVVGDDVVDDITVTSGTGFAVNDMVFIYVSPETFLVRKITAIASNVLTVDTPIPAGVTVAAGSEVLVVNMAGVGSKVEQPFLACKILGKLANNQPVALLLPKVRVTRGFNVNFSTQDFGNMPFELQIYDLVTTDPNYDFFKNLGSAAVLRT